MYTVIVIARSPCHISSTSVPAPLCAWQAAYNSFPLAQTQPIFYYGAGEDIGGHWFGINRNSPAPTNLLEEIHRTLNSHLLPPTPRHSLFKTDIKRGMSQVPCENCNFISSIGLNFNSFGSHL